MPICLNCEIELPKGTIDCPHCGEECEQEIDSNDGGILADAWGDEDDDQLSFGEAEADELPQVAPEAVEEELPQVEPVDANADADELPMASAEPMDGGDGGDGDDDKARRKAERAKRKAEADGDSDGDAKKKKKSTTGKRERPERAAGAKAGGAAGGGKTAKRAKKGAEAKPVAPKKDPTLSQNRKAVLMAVFSWFVFVGLYGGAFAKGLIWPPSNAGAAQANMANVMFASLGLFAMLFLWAHLKMGRYISVTTVVIALGVEGWFIIKGLENMPAFVGVGLFTLAQLMLLTGTGWLVRSFMGFLFTVLGGALFCIPILIDVYLLPPEAQVVRVRKLMAGEIGLDGTSTADGATRAETAEVWEEMIKVADEFEAAEVKVQELAGLLGLGFIEGLVTKPVQRERMVSEVVIHHLWMVNGGYTPGGEQKPDKQKGVDGLLDSLDFEKQTKEITDQYRAIRDRAIDRMMIYMRRYLEAPPFGSGTVGEAGKYWNVDVKMHLAGWNEPKTWPLVVQKDNSRFVVIDQLWREKTETAGEAKAKRVWMQRDWWNISLKMATELAWDDIELTHVVATARKLAVMDAEILVTETEAPAGAEVPADDGADGGEDDGAKDDGAKEDGDAGGDEGAKEDGAKEDGGDEDAGEDG